MPTIILVTGITGVGKSTLTGVLDGLKFLPEYSVSVSKIAEVRKTSEAEALRTLVSQQRNFMYEMRFKYENLKNLFEAINRRGYSIFVHYIGLNSGVESIVRAARRATKLRNNPVSPAEIMGEYRAIQQNFKMLACWAADIQLWDNEEGMRLVGRYYGGSLQLLQQNNPQWLLDLKSFVDPQPQPKKTDWNKIITFERKTKNEENRDKKHIGTVHPTGNWSGKKKGIRDVQQELFGRVTGGNAAGCGEIPETGLQSDSAEGNSGIR